MAIRQTEIATYSALYIQSLLLDLGAATPTIDSLNGAEVHLFKGDLVPSPATPINDLNLAECDFSGYGAATITAASTIKPGPLQWALHKSVPFALTLATPIIDNEVAGYWVEYTGFSGQALLFCERFSEPVQMAAVGDFLDLNIFVPLNLVLAVPQQE